MVQVYFLAGDSYPKDRHVEDALARRLELAGINFVPHPRFQTLAGAAPGTYPVAERVSQLGRVLRKTAENQPVFLIGRSSGCIAATLAAQQFRVSGLICLSYPFRQPGRALEPARFAHLAALATPTLIVQGDTDQYGGLEATQDYALSQEVALRFVEGRHRLDLSEQAWDQVASWITGFITEGATPPGAAFDEAFYLQTHRDVAAKICAGSLKSGLEHFERFGRRERRAHRFLPPAV